MIESCVGCTAAWRARAAVLCPSFYRAEIIRNPNWWDRALHRLRRTVIGWFTPSRARRGMNRPQPKPITILIAALGGEGGGVLTDWIVGAAAQRAFRCSRPRSPASPSAPAPPPITSRSSRCWRELPARPVLALAPGIGDVDIVLASELLEAGRAITGGFVTPDRTLMIASTARSYLVVEKWRWATAATTARG